MRRLGNACLVAEEVVGIERIPLAEPPTAAVELVATLLHHDVEHGPAIVAVFRGEAVVRELELLNDLHRRRVVDIGVSPLALLRCADGCAVEAHFRGCVPLAVGDEVGTRRIVVPDAVAGGFRHTT